MGEDRNTSRREFLLPLENWAVHIALTGATGFLGSRLLVQFLRRGAEVTVLARPRPRGVEDHLATVLAALRTPDTLLHRLRRRVRVVEGDISLPRLGLPPDRFRDLADRVDAVWHCAGDIRLNADLASLRTVNVQGIRHVLELAGTGRRSPRLYHVSTAFVAGSRRDGVAYERDLTDEHGFENSYEQSKYEAELLVHAWARRHQRPAVILRPSILVSDRPPREDLPGHTLQVIGDVARSGLEAVAASGSGPAPGEHPLVRMAGRGDGHLNFLPVDWAAVAMALLAERCHGPGVSTFHVVHPRDTPVTVLVRLFEHFLPVRLELHEGTVHDATELERMSDFYPGFSPYLRHRRRFDDTAARRLLGHLPPPPDIDLPYLLAGMDPAPRPARRSPPQEPATPRLLPAEPQPASNAPDRPGPAPTEEEAPARSDRALWYPGDRPPAYTADDVLPYVPNVREPAHLVAAPDGRIGLALGGSAAPAAGRTGIPLLGTLPPLRPEWLGDRSFAEAHGTLFPYIAGEMANGIATTTMVTALAEAGLLGFFGAAGLDPDHVERAVHELTTRLGTRPNWGVNLIHSPAEPGLEDRVAGLLLRHRVPAVSASAFMELTPAVVRLSATGLRRDAHGRVHRRTRVFAKVSRPEVASAFLSPAPEALLRRLVDDGRLTEDEARLAARVPVAEDITVEADSGGHTDNRPLTVLLPAVLALRDALARAHDYDRPVRVGAAGGLGTPAAVAAAFALGAAYVLTGSVNQAAVESGLSDDARAMLAAADVADVTMAPAADMFELGVRLQVLRRGTLFAGRATRLHELYRDHASWDAVPAQDRALVERDILQAPFDTVWAETRHFWQGRDPGQAARAESDLRHRMALVFRWYLGRSSRWAIDGHTERRADYQIWCGPAMGAFNRWTADSFLADPARRTVVQIARNLLEGAAVLTRAHQLRGYGVTVPPAAFDFPPRPLT
ncbi:hypothetical protein CTZ27_22705 [Streptomyces griseocarneus]|nr:hypothetical protein CTZ27_22705 [Streptomyces griseocarneus]